MDNPQYTAAAYHNALILTHTILHNVKKHYEENNELGDSDLIQLHSVYGDITEKALQLLENSSFVRLMTEDKKIKIYQVTGSSGMQYIIYPNYNYCGCSAYKYQVCKSVPTHLTCKHILAAKLAEITGKFKDEIISHTAIVELLMFNLTIDTTV